MKSRRETFADAIDEAKYCRYIIYKNIITLSRDEAAELLEGVEAEDVMLSPPLLPATSYT